MMGTKLLADITVRVIMFERCVEYDGYKTDTNKTLNTNKFEMCVEYDGYKTDEMELKV